MGPTLSAIHARLERSAPAVVAAVAVAMVGIIGAADFVTGAELSSSVFYALPVAVAAWYGSLPLGLANSRRFLAAVETEVARSHRYRRPLSLAYVDLDGFKAVNDQAGHATGDDVLETVGRILSHSVRATDLPARLGGDEFAVLLPETDVDQAKEAALKLRVVLETAMQEAGWPVGFSMGVYTSEGRISEADTLIGLADGLMYQVKHSGKGRTVFQSDSDRP